MTTSVVRSRGLTMSLRAYTMTLIVCSSLYFLRTPGLSVYIFDVIWLFGLALFPRYFLRMPTVNYLALIAFVAATFLSILYVVIDNRPIDVVQAVIILARFTQMAICANFFYNCVRSGKLAPRDFLVPALIALLIPLWGGLALYQVQPSMAVVFNRYSGYLANPNSLSLYVVVSSSVFYALMRLRLVPGWWTYPFVLIFFMTAAYSLILSGSNSGIALFVVVTMIAFSGSLRGGLFLLLTAAILPQFIGALREWVLPWAFDLMSDDFAGWQRSGKLILVMLEGTDLDQLGSRSYREEVSNYLFGQQFSDFRRVLIGLGPGQSKYLTFLKDGLTVTVHNFYMLIFLEFGILGSACFAAMSFLSLYRFLWSYSTLLMFSGFLFASLATPVLYLPFYWAPLFAALAGLTQAHGARRADEP